MFPQLEPAVTPHVASPRMHVLVYRISDEAWGQSEQPLEIFVDESVAELVAEQLNGLTPEQRFARNISRSGEFIVRPFQVCRAESESRVHGICQQILRVHFPKA